MEKDDIEEKWWAEFEGFSINFEKVCPDYNVLTKQEQIIGALFKMELDMNNGGFLQFFCNWGYDAYMLAIEGLEAIGAYEVKGILEKEYSTIEPIQEEKIVDYQDIPSLLTESMENELAKLDEEFWNNDDKVMEKMLEVYG